MEKIKGLFLFLSLSLGSCFGVRGKIDEILFDACEVSEGFYPDGVSGKTHRVFIFEQEDFSMVYIIMKKRPFEGKITKNGNKSDLEIPEGAAILRFVGIKGCENCSRNINLWSTKIYDETTDVYKGRCGHCNDPVEIHFNDIGRTMDPKSVMFPQSGRALKQGEQQFEQSYWGSCGIQ